MDLKEIQNNSLIRHPWELSRVTALRSILKRVKAYPSFSRILDIGCGDGYMVHELFCEFPDIRIDAVDINLSTEKIKEYSTFYNNINFHNSFEPIENNKYDLILMLDVIEHVEDDIFFVSDIVNRYANKDTIIFVTAPAYNSLFSSHDKYLNHYRRYNLKEIHNKFKKFGFSCDFSGYLYFILLPYRFFSRQIERMQNKNSINYFGIGTWNQGYFITKFIYSILMIDNFISLSINKLGVKIPGLTVWALCKKNK